MKREKEVCIEKSNLIWMSAFFLRKIYLDIEVKKELFLPDMNMMMTLI